ncbi:MAG TPA: hypothetical protein VFC84_14135 [Desulfosporosinus sp.]|nr:hypothetical protein [Desulfosporosinus sp.]
MFTILLPIEKAIEAPFEPIPKEISNQRLIQAKAGECTELL